MAQLICIREQHHPEIPEKILRQEFGSEIVVDSNSGRQLAIGTSVFLEGEVEDIRAWINSAGGKVWTSNNPMIGNWKLQEL